MKTASKILSVFLAVLMLLTSLPVSTFAMAAESDTTPAVNTAAQDDEVEEMAAYLLDALEQVMQMTEPYALTDNIVFYGDSLDSWVQSAVDAIANHGDELGGDFANLDVSAVQGLSRADGNIHFIAQILQFLADNAETVSKILNSTFDFGLLESHPVTAAAIADIKALDFYEVLMSDMFDFAPGEYTADAALNDMFKEAMFDFFDGALNMEASLDEFDMTEMTLYDFGLAVMSKLFDEYFVGYDLLAELLSTLRSELLAIRYPEASFVQVTDATQLAAVEAEFYENYKYGDSAMWVGADGSYYYTIYDYSYDEDADAYGSSLDFYQIVFPEETATYAAVPVYDETLTAELQTLQQAEPDKLTWIASNGYTYFMADGQFYRLIMDASFFDRIDSTLTQVAPSIQNIVRQEENKVHAFTGSVVTPFTEIELGSEWYFYENEFYLVDRDTLYKATHLADIPEITFGAIFSYAVTDSQEIAMLRNEYKPEYGCNAWLDSQGRTCIYYEQKDRFYIGLYMEAYYASMPEENNAKSLYQEITDDSLIYNILQAGNSIVSDDDFLLYQAYLNQPIFIAPGDIVAEIDFTDYDIYWYQDSYYIVMTDLSDGSQSIFRLYTTDEVREYMPEFFEAVYQPPTYPLPTFDNSTNNLWNYFDLDFTYKPEMFSLAEGYETYGGYVEQINHLIYQAIDLLFTDSAAEQIGWQDGATAEVFNENLSSLALTLFPKLAEAFAAEEPYFADSRFSAESVAEMSFEELAVTALELMWTTLDIDAELGITLPLGSSSLEQVAALAIKTVMESENGLAFP